MTAVRALCILGLAVIGWILAGTLLVARVDAEEPLELGCHTIPITEDTPTGIAGCQLYGIGTASHWGGPGVARNDCVWPWLECEIIHITSLDTGLTIIVRPTMFCDCYVTTADQRIVDLGPAELAALGLDPAQGLYRVAVDSGHTAAEVTQLPNTAMQP